MKSKTRRPEDRIKGCHSFEVPCGGQEDIKPIPGWEGLYSATNMGRIISHRASNQGRVETNTSMNYFYDKYGYRRVILCSKRSGARVIKNALVHRLVAIVFIDNIESLPQVNHIDGDKNNNIVSNLEWCSPQTNMRHAISTGLLDLKGESVHFAKLTEIQVKEIRSREMNRGDMYKWAKEFNVNYTCIYKIRKRESWKHV